MVVDAHRDVGSVGDYDICTAAKQIVGVAATGDTDDASESAISAGGCSGFGVLDDDTTVRPDSRSACCLDKHRGIRLAGKTELFGKDADLAPVLVGIDGSLASDRATAIAVRRSVAPRGLPRCIAGVERLLTARGSPAIECPPCNRWEETSR
jgi:hypothetical protein